MKAAVYRGTGDISIRNVPKPQIRDGEVLLEVLGCGMCGTDLKILMHGHRLIVPPRILGHEIVGRVIATRAKKSSISIGQAVIVVTPVGCMKCTYCRSDRHNMCPRVTDEGQSIGYYCDGGFAEYVRIPAEAVAQLVLIPIPETDIPLTHFALCEPLSCVINGQDKLRISTQDTVLVLGAGPIGCMHVCLAAARGAKKIILTDIAQKKLDLASQMPATHFVLNENGAVEKIVRHMTGGLGADVVIVAAPSGVGQEDAIRLAAPMGRISFFGGLPKNHPHITLDSNRVHYRELEIYGAYASSRKQYVEALELILTRKIPAERFISVELALDELNHAFELMKQHAVLKVVITP